MKKRRHGTDGEEDKTTTSNRRKNNNAKRKPSSSTTRTATKATATKAATKRRSQSATRTSTRTKSTTKSTKKTTTKANKANKVTKPKRVKVPNPPKSLITLLQKDKSVVTYFTALQQSLDGDVNEWKDKALDYRRQLKSLQAAQRAQEKQQQENDEEKNNNDDYDYFDANGTDNANSDAIDDDDDLRNGKVNDEHTKNNKHIPPVKTIELLHKDSNFTDDDDNSDHDHDNNNNNNNDQDEDDDNMNDDGTKRKEEKQQNEQTQHSNQEENITSNSYSSRSSRSSRSSTNSGNSSIHNDVVVKKVAKRIKKRKIETKDDNNDDDNDDDDNESDDGGLFADLHPSNESSSDNKESDSDIDIDIDSNIDSGSDSNSNSDDSDDSDSDSDSDDDSIMKEFKRQMMQQSKNEEGSTKIRTNVYSYLIEAFQSLELLGVDLVDTSSIAIIGMEQQQQQEQQQQHQQQQQLQHEMNVNVNINEQPNKLQQSDKNKSLNQDDVTMMDATLLNLEEEEDDDDDSTVDGFLSSIQKQKTKPKIEKSRRSDTSIVTDMMQSLKSLIRIPSLGKRISGVVAGTRVSTSTSTNTSTITDISTGGPCIESDFMKKWFQPFISNDFIPCCYMYDFEEKKKKSNHMFSSNSFLSEHDIKELPQHPLVNGLHSLCHALTILDTYCSSSSPFVRQTEWESIFENASEGIALDKEKKECMKLGMQKRDISTLLLDSIHGEIMTWADIERSARGTSASLKYLKDDEDGDLSDSDESHISNSGNNEMGDDEDTFVYSFSSKNQNRLFWLLERTCYARIVSFLYQYRSDLQNAARVVIEYVLSTTPSPMIEEYPRYSPLMSMCVLEALLLPISTLKCSESLSPNLSPSVLSPYNSWFSEFLKNTSDTLKMESPLANALSVSIFSAIDIWKQRKSCEDRRIREISEVELAAFTRLLKSEKDWLNVDYEFDTGADLMQNIIDNHLTGIRMSSMSLALPIQLSLQLSGDVNSAINTLQHLVTSFDPSISQPKVPVWPLVSSFFSGCVSGIQHIKWESNCMAGLSMEQVKSDIVNDERIGFILDHMIQSYKELIMNDGYVILAGQTGSLRHFATTILQCCLILGDGLRAAKAASLIVPYLVSRLQKSERDACLNEIEAILILSEFPLVRIINLKSRPDRWKNSITQAQKHKLFIVLAVAKLSLRSDHDNEQLSPDGSDSIKNVTYWGSHAHSGKDCSHLEFERTVSQQLDCNKKKRKITDYVSTHWRPRDLKAFDRYARDDDTLVRTSVSERACALSHISSWYGVHNSLVDMVGSESDSLRASQNGIDKKYMQQLFRISGFARGAPLLSENHNMAPCPVCIVLEDDAMLVDRFSERLGYLLNELPRDFHYCSIGYSRPKTAPMVPYSSQIGIPTCLWYCTGYILSLEGARYLIDSLPVVGPVDSWIGLMMTSNWDNTFGQRIRVGSVTKANIDKELLPSRKDLGMIMKFRAFAALTPLCSQKLKWSPTSGSEEQRGAKWRDRDTDVTYSGRQ